MFKLQIWDTAGQESFKSITKIFYRGAHCIFLAYDITRLETFNNLATWYNEVMDQSEPDVILFLVGNKLDMEDKREVSLDRVEKFKREKNIHFAFETSAMTGENIEDLFIMASKILYHNFKDKIAQLVSSIVYFSVLTLECNIERRSNKEALKQEAEEISPVECPDEWAVVTKKGTLWLLLMRSVLELTLGIILFNFKFVNSCAHYPKHFIFIFHQIIKGRF